MFDVGRVYIAEDVDDAIDALCAQESALLISGGTDVLVQNRAGKHAGLPLVSLHEVNEIKGVRRDDNGDLVIGAGTCFTDIVQNPLIQKYIPMLGEAADQVGGPQIRNMGTIGGNVCNGVTSADSAPSLLALEAELILRGKDGERRVALKDFYVGAGKTVRAREEVLCEIRIARETYENAFGCYIKYGKRNAMEISTLGCAALVRLSADKTCFERARIAFGVAAPTPVRCFGAEQTLAARPVGRAAAQAAAEAVASELSPRTSWRASREFRLHLAQTLCLRALCQAIDRAGGDAL